MAGWLAPLFFVAAPPSEGLAKLAFTIFWENLAIGIAGAAYIAWLSSIVAKKYAAVQFALLASLTLLIGTLGPMLTIVFSYWLLGEPLSLPQMAGAGLVLAGVLLVGRR